MVERASLIRPRREPIDRLAAELVDLAPDHPTAHPPDQVLLPAVLCTPESLCASRPPAPRKPPTAQAFVFADFGGRGLHWPRAHGRFAMIRLLALLLLLPALAAAAPWILDPATSVSAEIDWKDQPIVVRFPGLTGEVDFDAERLEGAHATLTVPAGAATTGNPIVDAMMRSGDFLDAQRHPTITFELDKLAKTSKDTASVTGKVTMRGVTRPVELDARVLAFGPVGGDPKRIKADFAITGTLDRAAFGSTAGGSDVSTMLPLDIRLVMTSR